MSFSKLMEMGEGGLKIFLRKVGGLPRNGGLP